ncbi:phosphodiester glycosidase family protein [Hymenobacter terricola]|uniref:phosphodiester glycosidase family protein n=1 Tax=Hymenobacter terricola TaxID=2819236 RepID=UPI001B30533D|nr:phosphodiester glycosidase family protein [Hymenobacter terricola]
MSKSKVLLFIALTVALVAGLVAVAHQLANRPAFISYRVDLRQQQLKLYWKDDRNQRFKSLEGLKKWLHAHGQNLVFAMNAGMFNPNYAPQGLFIQAQKTVMPLDTTTGPGNFYLKPNGVFYLTTEATARICKTEDFRNDGRVAYATQSGPMLVIDGKIHPAFRPGSPNLQIRNGVGILPNNQVLLAMSRTKISFYDFADYFKKAGCRQALYLDGFVSRTYEPAASWPQTDGDFGVIIGVTAPQPPQARPLPAN